MVFTRSWSRGHSYHRDIFVAPRDGSDAQHIEAKKENHDASWVSEDTLVLSAFRTFYDPNTDSLDAVGHDLYLVNVDGSGLTLLHHSPAKDSQPDWWP
jgi:hypothetical protein